MPWRWQAVLGREELLPYLFHRVMTRPPSNCALKWAGSHQQTGKGFQYAAHQTTEMGQAERQAGLYRTLMLGSRDGLHKFTLDLTWRGQERETERSEGRGSLAHYLLCLPRHRQRLSALLPCRLRGMLGLSLTERAGQTLIC